MIKVISSYIFFRQKQLFRVLKDIGIGHLIILTPILILVVLGILHTILTHSDPLVPILVLVTLIGNHWTRKDRFFLEQLPCPLRLFYIIDYSLLCSPFFACFIYWGQWFNLLLLLAGLLLLSIIKPPYAKVSRQKALHFLPLNWIPLEIFEWRCGFRKNPLLFLVFYGSCLALAIYPITAPSCVFLMALGVTTFFQFFEHKDLLLVVNKDQKLLQKKASLSLKLFNVLMLPHYLLFLFLHQGYTYWGALFIVSIVAQLLIVFAISMKYKSYSFHGHKIYNSLPLAIFVACLTIPFLWPIPVLMLFNFWKKAQENLIHHYA